MRQESTRGMNRGKLKLRLLAVLQTATHIYNKKASVIIYKKLAKARAVILPRDVSQEDQTLFAGADQPDPMDVLAGIHDPGNGGEPSAGSEKAAAPIIPPPAAGEYLQSQQ